MSHTQLQLPYQSKSLSNFTRLSKMRTHVDSVYRWFMQEFRFLDPSFKNQSAHGGQLSKGLELTLQPCSEKYLKSLLASSELDFTVLMWKHQNKNLSQEIMSFLCLSLTSMWKFPELKSLVQNQAKSWERFFLLSKWFIHPYSSCFIYPTTYLLLHTYKEKMLLHSTYHDNFLELTSS